MTSIHAAEALLPEGWRRDVRIGLEGSTIARIDVGTPPQSADERHAILLPGMANLHSHAFQRGMAGLAEVRGAAFDSFWTWRDVMYRFALAMTPDQVEAIAAELYIEMLEAGFTRVGEFHYLHHDEEGRPYGDLAEMSGRICAAAAAAGIGLTLLPVLYAHGAFGGAPPAAGQRRFINDADRFAKLHEGAMRHARAIDGAVVGVAPHSLRAVTPELLSWVARLAPGAPVHIHAAEQTREVEECLAWSGKRPVEWLLDHAVLDRRWCLVHATHMTPDETRGLARSGAVAGLCPVTEANLGDGTFPAGDFLAAGGRIGIGSDSNVLIGIGDELRQLEYSQRLRDRARNVLARAGGSTGRSLFDYSLAGGAQALGIAAPAIAVGARADLVSLDARNPSLAGRSGDAAFDSWLFASRGATDAVWAGGCKVVECGRHRARGPIEARFRKVAAELAGA